MKKYLVVIGILILITIGGMIYWQKNLPDKSSPASQEVEKTDPVNAVVVGQENKPDEETIFDWKLEERGEDEDSVPVVSVRLEVMGSISKGYDLGEFGGNCFVIDGLSWELLENELSGVICWWAGGGEEVGVFEENGVMEIRRGTLEEGGADVGNYRGNFQKVFRIE